MPGIHTPILSSLAARGTAAVLSGNNRCAKDAWTGDEVVRAVRELSGGLREIGVRRGTKVGIVADNHDLWLIADLAILSLGAIDVPRAADAPPDEVAFVLDHSDARVVFIEDAELTEKLLPTLASVAGIERIVVMKGPATAGTVTLEELREIGRAHPAPGDPADPGEVATIVYTSGTTGNPKGVMLTHENILHNIRTLPGLVSITENDSYLSFLPSWHTFERTFAYCLLAAGARITYSSKATLRKDLLRVHPTLVAGVPRLWESIAQGVIAKIAKLPPLKRRIAGVALAASQKLCVLRFAAGGRTIDDTFAVRRPGAFAHIGRAFAELALLPLHAVADRLVYAKIRESLGENIRFIVSGGGALPLHVDELLNRAGVCLLNGYGLTETAPVVSVRLPERNILATAGRPLAQTSFRVMSEDEKEDLGPRKKGVLWIRGPQVMKGYFKNPEATAKVLRDGWFNSGDLAVLTDEGDVVICGRVKDTVVLRGGENVEPENIEAELIRSPLIADAVVVGHAQKHLAALVVPNAETILGAPASGPGDFARLTTDEIRRKIHAEVQRLISAERGFRVFERVPKIAVIPEPFSVESGTLTPTLKKRRHVIESVFAERIRGLFADGDDGD